jgi:hypothetical protein
VSYEIATRHAVPVDADSGRVDQALREVTFGDVPLVRALVFARGLGLPEHDQRVLDAMRRRASVIEDVPGRVSFKLEGRFWRVRGRGDEPAATAIVGFQAERGLLSTETHVSVPLESRGRFQRYWFVVRPFSSLIRRRVLLAAKRRAEAR